MRDDIAEIIATLHSHYTKKSALIEKLSLNETQLFFSVKAGNTDNAHNLLDEAQSIIDEIDHVDAIIGGTSDILRQRTGTANADVAQFLAGPAGAQGEQIIGCIERIRTTMEAIYKKRTEVNELLDRQIAETGENIDGLAQLRKIRYRRDR